MNKISVVKKIIALLALATLVGLFFYFDLARFLTLEVLKSQRDHLVSLYGQNPFRFIGLYVLIYVLITATSVPGATILTLAGGALFGFGLGVVVVSFASTIGATLSFLISRYLLRDFVKRRFEKRYQVVDDHVKKEGLWYLLSLRLVPVFPFFVINLLMGLTSLSTLRFYGVSQVGMLPGTMVYVNAGTQLAKVENIQDIMSPTIFISFGLMGLLPLVSKWFLRRAKLRINKV